MAQQKLPIKDILAAIDMGAHNVWDELTDDERKQVSFWLLNRYVSSVSGSEDDQALAIFKTNKYYNKNFNDIGVGKDTGHPKLLWQLLCISGNTKKVEYHSWIGHKKRGGDNTNKAIKLLNQIYPHLKDDEVEVLARISTKKELKELAKDYDIDAKL